MTTLSSTFVLSNTSRLRVPLLATLPCIFLALRKRQEVYSFSIEKNSFSSKTLIQTTIQCAHKTNFYSMDFPTSKRSFLQITAFKIFKQNISNFYSQLEGGEEVYALQVLDNEEQLLDDLQTIQSEIIGGYEHLSDTDATQTNSLPQLDDSNIKDI